MSKDKVEAIVVLTPKELRAIGQRFILEADRMIARKEDYMLYPLTPFKRKIFDNSYPSYKFDFERMYADTLKVGLDKTIKIFYKDDKK